MRDRIVSVVTVMVLAITHSACTTMSGPTFQPSTADRYGLRQEQQGLLVAAHAMVTAAEMDEVFRANLLENGFLPVLLVLENRSPSSTFVIDAREITAGDQARPA